LKVRVDSAPLVLSPIRSNERRVQWPLVVLLLSIGLTAIGAVDAQRAIRSQREVADRALREYANFAAWSYSQHLALALDGIGREVLGAVNHGDNLHTSPHVPDARELAQYLRWDDACGCRRTFVGPSPAAFFAVDLRKRVLSESDNLATGGSGPTAMPTGMYSRSPGPRPASAELRTWLVDSLPTRIRGHPGMNRGFRFVVAQNTVRPHIIAHTIMPLAWGDTMVYVAAYSSAAFQQHSRRYAR
jgi:hypothetical protein